MNTQTERRFSIPLFIMILSVGAAGAAGAAETAETAEAEPARIRALLVAGGCCHDYEGQHAVLSAGIQARADVRVDVVWTDDRSTNPPLPLYDNPDWAAGYDVVIHDECAAGNGDVAVLERILNAHRTIPAVHLHCAMHSFRNGTDRWFEHLGLQSTGHGPQQPIAIQFTDRQHPITAPLRDWTTGREELYNNVRLFDAHPLATGTQTINGKDVTQVVAWTNEKQGARSFSTTIGHNTATVADPRYLDLVTRGLLWACGKLDADHLKPYAGQNSVTLVKTPPPPPPAPLETGAAPDDATLVKVTASSTQNDRFTWMAVDGRKDTRWCAANDSKPQWLQLEFDEPVEISGVGVLWEIPNSIYGYSLEGSLDGQNWTVLHNAVDNQKPGATEATFPPATLRFLRLNGIRSSGGWISLWELSVTGKGIQSLFPKLEGADKKAAEAAARTANDPHAKSGNVKPRIVNLTAAEEAAILEDVKVPAGFDVRLFAPSETANYPVYVAASPAGDLFVSSDGNGSLGRDPGRGRVLRLRDADGDGRADQVTEFVPDIDSPRGLIWDHDRLYLLHPPHISVFFDRDGDGIAETSKRLIDGIAFGFEDRPADHTTNGLELGIDGWIYVAGGDFGFMDATGTDGRHLQHRGGGVIRFRPDGSGLDLFATGTRNILGTPMSPLLDLFARDNTNDGGGWDVRFHHFSGLEDHGYPRLYQNFADEHIHPLADYGGGSGCGSVYIHEPGFPREWNHAPFTCDWGRAAIFHHAVKRHGASFAETAPPRPFIRLTRPTDADVDAMSRVYLASWKGPATFNWAGPDQGYIVRVTPSGFQPEPLPDFDALRDPDLVALLESDSHLRTLTAQRTLLRRAENPVTTRSLLALAAEPSAKPRTRVAALYAVSQRGVDGRQSARVIDSISPLASDPALQPFVLRALGDMAIDRLTVGKPGPAPADLLIGGLRSRDARTRVEAIAAAARQGNLEAADAISANLGHADPVIAHTAFRALAILGAADACFAILDNAASTTPQRNGAAHALMRMHRPDVVDDLINRLHSNAPAPSRKPILAALCRLYHREAEWTGDSWGTRPDTRGPYYQPETWEPSEKILAVLKQVLEDAAPAEAAELIGEMNRNRIQSDTALRRIIALATSDKIHVAAAVTQLAAVEIVPPDAVPLLLGAARGSGTPPMVLAQAIACLARIEHADALEAMLTAMAALENTEDAGKARQAGRGAFLRSAKLENQYAALAAIAAADPASGESRWAHAGLLELAARKTAGPEARSHANQAIDLAWQDPDRRITLMTIAGELRNHHLDARIRAAMSDFDPDVASAAEAAARRLRIPAPGEDTTPKIDSLEPEQVLNRVMDLKGDPALGEAVFIRAACATCHTVSQDQPLKGPYLGNIASTYRRRDLAESILDPNKTIAQGFATQALILNDETELTGFITHEAADQITLRDVTATEYTIPKNRIADRSTTAVSIMPSGLMSPFSIHEMASLLDYLEGLAKQE